MFVQYENLGGPCYLTLGNIEEQRISHPAGYKQGCYAAGREHNQNSNRHDHGFFFLNKGVWQITHKQLKDLYLSGVVHAQWIECHLQ